MSTDSHEIERHDEEEDNAIIPIPVGKPGPPTKLTEHRLKLVLQLIEVGGSYAIAAKAGGISAYVFREWRREGRREIERRNNGGDGPITDRDGKVLTPEDGDAYKYRWLHLENCVRLIRRIEEVEASAALRWLTTIDDEAERDPKWSAWLLEKMEPSTYGQQSRKQVEVTTPEDKPIQHVHTLVRGDDIERMGAILNFLREAGALKPGANRELEAPNDPPADIIYPDDTDD